MRVIEYNYKEHFIRCDSCKSHLAFIDPDVQFISEYIFGEWHWHKFIRCPVCHNKIILEAD